MRFHCEKKIRVEVMREVLLVLVVACAWLSGQYRRSWRVFFLREWFLMSFSETEKKEKKKREESEKMKRGKEKRIREQRKIDKGV